MKNLFFALLFTIFVLIFISCEDNSTDPKPTTFKKMKISVYLYDAELSKYILEDERYFDGDVTGLPRRTYRQIFGEANYQNEVELSDVPLPTNKFGCPIKEISYDSDTQYVETNYEYDGEGYLKKIIDKIAGNTWSRSIDLQKISINLYILNIYEDDELTEIQKWYLDNGLCTLQVDSTPNQNDNFYTYYEYNSKRQKISEFITQNNVNGDLFTYYYDEAGNNILKNSYSIYRGDTTLSYSYERVMYKGYLVDPDIIEYLEFDSGNNIVGYNYVDGFVNRKYKITYEYY